LVSGDEIMADLDSSLFSRRPTLVCLIAAGATEQTRNRVSTADRTRMFDQRVGAESVVLDLTAAPSKIVASDNPNW
jgi:hypothetical protein